MAEPDTVPCEICGTPTPMTGTRRCDPCWEAERHAVCNPVELEDLVRRLARVIDPDEPPGLAAHQLARSVVSLVKNRGGLEAARLIAPIDRLAEEVRRA